MEPNEFIKLIAPGATACAVKHGIPASFTIAQAALESAWGSSKLANSGFNLFGVKADASWHGPTTIIQTREFLKGEWVMVAAKWRCYSTWAECVMDRAEFFKNNPRYAKCFAEKTGAGWAVAVAAAGYATDPFYANKIIATIRARGLEKYDA